MKRNEALEVATRELTKRGIPYEVVRSKKHWQVRWMILWSTTPANGGRY
jgi:hypothetical protein